MQHTFLVLGCFPMTERVGSVQTRALTVDGTTVDVVVVRKSVKYVNARLQDTTLKVSVPMRMRQEEADRIITDLARTLVRRAHARRVNSEDDAVALVQRVAARFPSPPAVRRVVFVTTQMARWGSYSVGTGTIRLHAALRRMPRWVMEAVAAHELAHAVHPDHSTAFWALARHVCPETDRARAFLAGVNWLAQSWEQLPPVERALLTSVDGGEDGYP